MGELVKYPFLDKAGKEKQRENLTKFDARIREQFRETVNFFTLGLTFKEKGSFGSIYGKENPKKEEGEDKKMKEERTLINTIESNNTQSMSQGLDTKPSYGSDGMMVLYNTTTYIQPVEV